MITRDVYKLSEKDQMAGYELFIQNLKEYLPDIRLEAIKPLLDRFDADMASAPASPSDHGAYIGGYLEHVNDVIEYSVLQRKIFEKQGLSVPSEEAVVFAAAFHDIGKISDGSNDHYIPEDSPWHRENLGRNFKINEKPTAKLHHADKSLFLLQKFGIQMTLEEYQAIRLHDGPGAPINSWHAYQYGDGICLLAQIIRAADMAATVYRIQLDKEEKGMV